MGGLHCLAHSSLLLSQQKSRCYIKFVKWRVRKNRALSMSKNDDELNEFIDEVTDGVQPALCRSDLQTCQADSAMGRRENQENSGCTSCRRDEDLHRR